MAFLTPEQTGSRIKTLREARGISREELCAGFELSPAAVAEAEAGRSVLATQDLVSVAAALGVRPHSLLRDDEDRAPLFRTGSDPGSGQEAMARAEGLIDEFFALEALARP